MPPHPNGPASTHRLARTRSRRTGSSPGAPRSMEEGCRAAGQVPMAATLEPERDCSRRRGHQGRTECLGDTVRPERQVATSRYLSDPPRAASAACRARSVRRYDGQPCTRRCHSRGTADPPNTAPASDPAIAATVSVSPPPRIARSTASVLQLRPYVEFAGQDRMTDRQAPQRAGVGVVVLPVREAGDRARRFHEVSRRAL